MITLQQKRQLAELRRARVLDLSSKGYNQTAIAKEIGVTDACVSRDISFLKQQAKSKIREYIDNELPNEYNKTLVGITSILKESWIASLSATGNKDKLAALSLAKDCYSMKLDLLTNATVVESAVKFVEDKEKEKEQKLLSESDESLEEEQEREQ